LLAALRRGFGFVGVLAAGFGFAGAGRAGPGGSHVCRT
jgi:hypothetical protein